MVFARIWHRVAQRRPPSTVQIFRQASRYRDAGRFEEAATLVARGLRLDPDNIVGHLLAGSLHAIFREMPLARAAFERALARYPDFPEAQALLDVVRSTEPSTRLARAAGSVRVDRLRVPPDSRELL